ncbi:MAG: sortase [Candidatus Dormibacteria bacterium]
MVSSSVAERESLTRAQPGKPVGFLTIPAIGLERVPIYERGLNSRREMLIAPGPSVTHYAFSSPLGGGSNAVLYAHDDIEGAVFVRLSELRAGDTITLETDGGRTSSYVVGGPPWVVRPDAVRILARSARPELTLFTCYPNHVDTARVVVVAVPQ